MSLTSRFKQRRADFIAALARDHDSGLGELFRLYWLSGMDAADLFFEKFGPGAFCQEHMEAEKKSILGKMQTIVLDYVGQFPGLPKAHRGDLETLAGTLIDAAFDARLAERHKAAEVVRRLALRPRAQRHAEARV